MPGRKKKPTNVVNRRRLLSLGAGLILCVGFLATSGVAQTASGPLSEEADLVSLLESKLPKPAPQPAATPARGTNSLPSGEQSMGAAVRLAGIALLSAGMVFLIALGIKRARERRLGENLGSNLSIRDSVWVGRGQRILVLGFEGHKVLVGVSGGALHSLGIFGEEGEPVAPASPIEREAALRDEGERKTAEFADLVRGELVTSLAKATPPATRDRRRKMLHELNSL